MAFPFQERAFNLSTFKALKAKFSNRRNEYKSSSLLTQAGFDTDFCQIMPPCFKKKKKKETFGGYQMACAEEII